MPNVSWRRVEMLRGMPGAVVAAALSAVVLAGCGQFPRDPQHTLERVSGGKMIVGVAENPPYVVVDGNSFSGIEPELLSRFSDSIEAEITWYRGTESELADALKAGRIDMMAAGLKKDSAWKSEVSFARPYHGDRVIALPKGENAFVTTFERYIIENRSEIQQMVAEQMGK
jgi:ABC-type amino acid transport substrate-binding protein